MNTPINKDQAPLSTADLAAAGSRQQAVEPEDGMEDTGDHDLRRDDEDELAQLFPPDIANDFRARWDEVQIGFVDDPSRAVREADELVAQVMQSLADSFAKARSGFEGEISQAGNASTESMRVALQRYRSFFQRLLSL
jgi:hypothetical protein